MFIKVSLQNITIEKGENKMDMESILLLTLFLFAIIYLAVRLAIRPLLHKTEEIIKNKNGFGLVKLRDIEILSPLELEEVIELYQSRGEKKEGYEQYQKYAKVLNELKVMDYFTFEDYLSRVDKLRKYYKVS